MRGGRAFRRKFRAPDGKVVETEIFLDLADLDPGDVETDAATVSGQLGLIAELLAEATTAHLEADAFYRHWRGLRMSQAAQSGDSEWLARAHTEGDKRFLGFKRTIARLKGDMTFLELYSEALQDKGARVRDRIALRGRLEGAASLPVSPKGAERKAVEREERSDARSRRARLGAAMRAARQEIDEHDDEE